VRRRRRHEKDARHSDRFIDFAARRGNLKLQEILGQTSTLAATAPEAFLGDRCRMIRSGRNAVAEQFNRVGFNNLSNFVAVFSGLCLLGGFPAYSATPADHKPSSSCLIGTIDLPPASGVIKGLKSYADCKAGYPAACENGAAKLTNNCKSQCNSQKDNKGQPCSPGPVTAHRPEYNAGTDCELEGNDKQHWTVSCTVTAQSCACNSNK
jgi:hypothetical protein